MGSIEHLHRPIVLKRRLDWVNRTPVQASCTAEEPLWGQSNTCTGHLYCRGALMGSIEHLHRPFVLKKSLVGSIKHLHRPFVLQRSLDGVN